MPEASEPRKPQGYAGPKNPQKKPRSKASPARLAALDVVRAVRERDAFAQDVIGTRIDRSDLSSEDRAFATKLALGVVSSTGTLDEIIDRARAPLRRRWHLPFLRSKGTRGVEYLSPKE